MFNFFFVFQKFNIKMNEISLLSNWLFMIKKTIIFDCLLKRYRHLMCGKLNKIGKKHENKKIGEVP